MIDAQQDQVNRPAAAEGDEKERRYRRVRSHAWLGVNLPAIWNVRTQLLRPFVDRSFDHPVGAQEDGLRDRDAESLGGLEVDDQFELRGLLDGQVARLRALENPVHVACGPARKVGRI